MKTFIDNKLLLRIAEGSKSPSEKEKIVFGWPSLLEYLELGSLFEMLPKFDAENKLFSFLLSALAVDFDKELLIRIYDQIFVENLTQIKALPQIQPAFLLKLIQLKIQTAPKPFLLPLDYYEKLFKENPSHAIHDLVLYLAWDRVCVHLAILFDQSLTNPQGLEVLKECLIESFQHITKQGKTTPGFFRLVEALYAYEMREENLQKHSESEWMTLCQSSRALIPREDLSDLYYIDAAFIDMQDNSTKLRMLTIKTPDKVHSGISLARLMIEKLKREIPGWQYTLCPVEIVYI